MGKIFKKVVCLLLGAILGVTSILATVVTAGYYMYSELPVGNIVAPGKEEQLGDVGDFSVEDLLDLLQQGSTAPENYTIADLRKVRLRHHWSYQWSWWRQASYRRKR